MRILYVADGRSPTALNWISYFVEAGHEVHLASSFRTRTDLNFASQQFVPVAFSERAGEPGQGAGSAGRIPIQWRTRLRQWAGPMTLEGSAGALRELASRIEPDLVHAMRIPFEGMLAGQAGLSAPLLISVWGNDFTLHAASSPYMKRATRKATCRADALHSDTQRDSKLSWEWGFDPAKPSLVAPGNGGIRSEIFNSKGRTKSTRPTVINPRGLRSYVRNDLFFKAIPLVLKEMPETRFLCPAMEGRPEAENFVGHLGIEESVELLPMLSAQEMADNYLQAQVMVSPSEHDGTPNSMLEAMACGSFPVAGRLDSVEEWIEDGRNGRLVELNDEHELAEVIIESLKNVNLRSKARKINQALISERAAYANVMPKVATFYEEIIASK
jgi:glycosyltransferase involved in cell wall biosynthesis